MIARHYRNLDVCLADRSGRYEVQLVAPDGTTASMRTRAQWSDRQLAAVLDIWDRIADSEDGFGPEVADVVQEFGAELFRTILHNDGLDLYRKTLQEAATSGSSVRIRLQFQNAPELACLPWEYLWDPEAKQYPALNVNTPIIRYMSNGLEERPAEEASPLSILIASASPAGWSKVEVDREIARLEQALAPLKDQGRVHYTHLDNITWDKLQRGLRTEPYHVVHFIGHGDFDKEAETGVLVFDDGAGNEDKIEAPHLAGVLRNHDTLRLVVLNACLGARSSETDFQAGIAQTLIQQHIPLVVAMQHEITEDAAVDVAHTLHAALADGYPLESAITEVRVTLNRKHEPEWGVPVVYSSTDDTRVLIAPLQDAEGGPQYPRTVLTLADLRRAPASIEQQYISAWTKRWSTEQSGAAVVDAADDPAAAIPLLPLQQEVFSHPETFRWPGKNLLITGPTSAGKTFLAEALMAHVRSQFQYRNFKCIYAVPLRALATEKHDSFVQVFGKAVTAVSSSDHRDDDARILFGEDKKVVVVVYEKLYLWLARARDLLSRTALLIVDELQMVGNPERGAKLEMILTWARDYQEHHKDPQDPETSDLRIVGLAPEADAVSMMAPWLGAVPIHCDPRERPVPLVESILTLDNHIVIGQDSKIVYREGPDEADTEAGDTQPATDSEPEPIKTWDWSKLDSDDGATVSRITCVRDDLVTISSRANAANSRQRPDAAERYRRTTDVRTTQSWTNLLLSAVKYYVTEPPRKKVLVYRATKRSAVQLAKFLAQSLGLEVQDWAQVKEQLSDLEDTQANDALLETMAAGIGFHHGDMTPDERRLVERNFRGRGGTAFELSVVVATPTLGMGINLPADVVIMGDISTYHVDDPSLKSVKPLPLSVLEYKNFAGRAGRYRWDDPDRFGICLLLGASSGEKIHTLEKLVEDPAQSIRSTLDRPQSGLEPYVLATVGWLGERNRIERDQILDIFKRTYAQTLRYPIEAIAEQVLNELLEPSNSGRRPLLNRRTHSFVRGSNVAAAAAVSIGTYDLLLSLQYELPHLLKAPMKLIGELSAADEVIRLYPSSVDTNDRMSVADTVRALRAFYKSLKGIELTEDAELFKEEEGNPDDYTLAYLIRAAAAWRWMQGTPVKDVAKDEAFPRVQWGHLSDLGEALGALVETLGRMWVELSGASVSRERQEEIIREVRLLSLQLRHGVPTGIEEVANLGIPHWHRDHLVKLAKDHPWEHPQDLLWLRPESIKEQRLRHRFNVLRNAIRFQRGFVRDPGIPWKRQVNLAHRLSNEEYAWHVDPQWPDLIAKINSAPSSERVDRLFDTVCAMLSTEPLPYQAVQIHGPDNDAQRGTALVRLSDGRHVVLSVTAGGSEEPVTWNQAASVAHTELPDGLVPAGYVTVAWPGYAPDVAGQLQQTPGTLTLFSFQAFVQACLNVIADPLTNLHKLDNLMAGTGAMFLSITDIDRVMAGQRNDRQNVADEYLGP